MTNRAWRAMETYGADPRITAEAFRAYKYDLAYSDALARGAECSREVLAVDPGKDADLRQAHDLLQRLGSRAPTWQTGARRWRF